MRRSVWIVVALLAVAFVLIGVPSLLISPTTSTILPEHEPDPESEIVYPTGGESGFWPYVNSRQAFEKRSPINVVIIGDTETVIRLLTEDSDVDWEETNEEQQAVDSETYAVEIENESEAGPGLSDGNISFGATEITWSQTTGALRYAYVDPGEGAAGQWIEETAQVHDGTYFGHRYHSRLYEGPNREEPWVAIQTHSEHFDWFTLRHRVHGSQAAQARMEADLASLRQVTFEEDVSRVYLGNGNASDADGWATFVDLLGIWMVGFVAFSRRFSGLSNRISMGLDDRLTARDRQRIAGLRERIDGRHLVLASTLIALVLGVRLGGIALEQTGILSMHGVAAVLYPFIGLGLPIATYTIASGLDRRLDGAVVASGSLAVAIWLDYGILGVHTLPFDVIVQRMLVVITLGLLAGGAAKGRARNSRGSELLVSGVVIWMVLLSGTLFGYL